MTADAEPVEAKRFHEDENDVAHMLMLSSSGTCWTVLDTSECFWKDCFIPAVVFPWYVTRHIKTKAFEVNVVLNAKTNKQSQHSNVTCNLN